jgi:hypothetical protein
MIIPEYFYYRALNNGEVHVFYKETRIFIMKKKWIKDGSGFTMDYWTCKSTLSYVPSFKEPDFDKAKAMIMKELEKFLNLFSEDK